MTKKIIETIAGGAMMGFLGQHGTPLVQCLGTAAAILALAHIYQGQFRKERAGR